MVPAVTATGDANGDGDVSPDEFADVLAHLNTNGVVSRLNFEQVLSNYVANTSLRMENVLGLGSGTVNFALTNLSSVGFSVEVSSNLTDWEFLGPATGRFLFTDPDAPTSPQRFYRLRYP